MQTGAVSLQQLSRPGYRTAVQKGKRLLFYGETDSLDVYDLSTGEWFIGLLPVKLSGAVFIAANDAVYVAGGMLNSTISANVWKLEF